MAGRISVKDSGKFGTSSNEFFFLSDDGDTATVRFLYEEPDGSDLDYYLVHQVEIDGKKRYVACLGVNDDGRLNPDNCPLCKAGYYRLEKLFLQVYDETSDTVKTWDRGKTFVGKIMSFINRYKSLVAQPIEIERRGKKGDSKTSYELFPLQVDDKGLADFPAKQELLGSFILDISEADMESILDGTYQVGGGADKPTDTPPVRRRSNRKESPAEEKPASSRTRRRRTSSNNDAF